MSFSNKRNAESKRHISLVMQTLHKWLSLIVGLQLLIWIVTGLAFNLIDERFSMRTHIAPRIKQRVPLLH